MDRNLYDYKSIEQTDAHDRHVKCGNCGAPLLESDLNTAPAGHKLCPDCGSSDVELVNIEEAPCPS